MCESSVFKIKKDGKEKLMDNVTLITVDGNKVNLSGMFGEQKTVEGRILKIDSERHEVYIE
ncbi:MAG: CooT family nickel-binding protein [Candidatus Hydrothermarchaeales archaeon]